jgi:threonine synthase
MMGFEAEGAAPIARGYPIEKPETVASAIRIGNPASWEGAVKARDESGGEIGMVSDAEILTAYRMIADLEGVFCEPASAVSVAGVIKRAREGFFGAGDVVVCTLTGHGLKDPDTALTQVGEVTRVPASLERLAEVLDVG